MGICLRYAQNKEEAQEILNDGFMKVFDKVDQYDTRKSFIGWLRKILINTAIDQYRKNFKHYHLQEIDMDKSLAINQDVISDIGYNDILTAIRKLSPAYRTIFNLHVIEGFKHEEIAEMLQISIGTSKSNLFKARENLKVILKLNDQEPYAKSI